MSFREANTSRYLRRQLCYFIYIVFLLSSCLAEQTNPLTIETCFDGIQNQDEEDVDCGGKCTACKIVAAPCRATLVDNRVTFRGVNYTFTSANLTFKQRPDYFEIVASKSGIYITIMIYVKTLPVKNSVFPLTPYNGQLKYATIGVIQPNLSYSSSSGDIYIWYKDNKWSIEFCSASLFGGNGSYPISGRINYP